MSESLYEREDRSAVETSVIGSPPSSARGWLSAYLVVMHQTRVLPVVSRKSYPCRNVQLLGPPVNESLYLVSGFSFVT